MHETTVTAAEETVTATIVKAVAEETGRDPFELPPLYETVDTDALNQLANQSSADHDSDLTVTFAVAGCMVQVTGAGEVRVTDSEEARGSDSGETGVESECENLDAGPADAPAETHTDTSSGATTDKAVAFESFDANQSETVESFDASESETVEPSASNPTAKY